MTAEAGRREWQRRGPPYSAYEAQPYYHPHPNQEYPSRGPPLEGRPPYGGPSSYSPQQQQQQMQRGGPGPPHGPPPREYWYSNEGPPPPQRGGPPPGWEHPDRHYEQTRRYPPMSPAGMQRPPMPPPPRGAPYSGPRDAGPPHFMLPSHAPPGMQLPGMMNRIPQGGPMHPQRSHFQPRRDYSERESSQWMPPHQRASNEEEELAQESSEEEEEEISKSTAEQKQQEGDSSNREKGDPLSLLANVSSDMVDPGDKQGDTKSRKQQKKNIKGSTSSKALPTSPLQRRPQPHPIITPKGRIGGAQQQQHRPPPQPQQHGPPQHSDSQPITPTIGYYQPYYEQPHQQDYHPGPPPPGQYPGPPPPYAQGGYPPPPQQQQQQHQQQYYRGNVEWEAHPGFSPAVVERGSGSFDSSDGSPEYHDRRPYYDYRGPPDSGDYSQPPPQRQQQPPPQHWQRMAPPPDGPGRPYPQPRYSYQGYPQQLSSPYPPPIPPPAFAPPRDDHERPTGKHAPSSRIRTTTASTTAAPFSPYSYVQQPRLEDKTMLRKKFSWKHFPELERFLIENRDEYLRHSSKNYTAEQKQYNNRLTEELLEVAEEHHYVFDPEDFNFVAIRDRIRCYYKSYVQTARKRGLQVAAISPSKKQKVKKESRGTDTEADIEAEEKDDVVIDKGTDTEADIEAEEKDDVVIDKGTDTEADIEAEEKDDVVIDKETDGKQSDEKNEDNRKIGEKKAEATAEKKIDETGAGEELDTADAKEVLKEGVGKAA